jgi:hypothetical protein
VDVLALVIIIALLGAVVYGVSRPLRGGAQDAASADASRVADLLAARDAKYREIRDLELDHQTGKLQDADFKVQDRALRAEALVILRELDRFGDEATPADPPDDSRA